MKINNSKKFTNVKLTTPMLNAQMNTGNLASFGMLPSLADLNLKTDEKFASQNIITPAIINDNFQQINSKQPCELCLNERAFVNECSPFVTLINSSPFLSLSLNNLIIKPELKTKQKTCQ